MSSQEQNAQASGTDGGSRLRCPCSGTDLSRCTGTECNRYRNRDEAAAQKIALEHAGVKAADATIYKNLKMYTPPKLLIRKTGLGIYASIDYTGSMTSQTVYILKLKDREDNTPLEYYLALLNSRVVYYFYLKVYGENEWKSHPYLTKQIIYSLPIQKYTQSALDIEIVKLARELVKEYEHSKDLQLEKLICQKYHLTDAEIQLVYDEMNRLPDLGAVNNMKVEVEASV